MTNRRWRILAGTINAVAAFLLVQPAVQVYPLVMLLLGALVAGIGYMKVAEDEVPPDA